MKTLGLIGGISYHSTAVYYDFLNQQINERVGGDHTAKLLLYSVNYHDFKQLQNAGDWKGIEMMLSDIASRLEKAGVDCIVICCNTAHVVAEELKQKMHVPFLHIAEETAKEITKHNIKRVGLLGTTFTMESPFFIDILSKAGIETILPIASTRKLIHDAIVTEMSKGYLSHSSKEMFRKAIRNLKLQGAEAVVFGCTEIGMLITQAECELKVFDTTILHANAAVDFALAENEWG